VSPRRRRILLITAAALVVLVLLAVLAVAWLLNTGGGRDFALARLQATLAPDSLSVERAEGPLTGPLTLHGVHYTSDEGIEIRIARLHLDYSPRGLLGRRVEIHTLEADDVDVRLPPPADDAPARPFELPDALPWPDLQLPVDLRVAAFAVRGLRLRQAEDLVFDARRLDAAVLWQRGHPLQLDRLALETVDGDRLHADGWLATDGEPAAALRIELQPVDADQPLTLEVSDRAGGIAARLQVPGSGQAVLELERDFSWRLDAALSDLRLDRWIADADPEPIDLALRAHGSAELAEFEGRFARADRVVLIEPSLARVDLAELQLALDPLQLALDDGSRVAVRGSVGLVEGLPLDLLAELEQLALPVDDDAPARLDGRLRIVGPLDRLELALDGRIAREELAADLSLQALLQGEELLLERFEVAHGAGRLSGAGRVGWAEQPQWQIEAEFRDFDPGVLAADFAGRLDGALRSEGRLGEDGLALTFELERLRGTLRNRPLQAHGSLLLTPDAADADLTAQIGDSRLRVRGVPTAALDLQIEIDPLWLADLTPDGRGRVQGRLRLRGIGDDARIEGSLQVEGLEYGEHAIARGRIDIDTRLDFARDARITLEAADAVIAGEPLERIRLDASGGFEGLAVEADIEGPRLALSGRWQGRRDGDDWAGELQRLRLRSGQMPTLELEAPASLSFGEAGLELGEQCLAASQGRVCYALTHVGDEQRIELRIDALPLAILEPWISPAVQPLHVRGQVQGEGRLRIVAGRPHEGALQLASAAGELQWEQIEAPSPLLAWSDLRIDARLQDGQLQLGLDAVIDGEGRLHARLSGGSPFDDMDSALAGRIELVLPQLRVLSLLPDTVVAPEGRMQAEVDLGGRWSDPTLAAALELSGFAAEIPALGIALTDSSLSLRGDQRQIAIDGQMHSGDGVLRLQGSIDDPLDALAVRLQIAGSDVRVVDTPMLKAVASPDLQAEYVAERLRLTGTLVIPRATLQLEQLDNTVAPSPDVVVLDPHPGREQRTELPLFADIKIELGKDVLLKGFGFDGGITGTVQVRERPDRPTTGRGTLQVRGEYTAYGQDLTIERGRLIYANTPIDDPRLDLRVGRTVREIEVGLDILGHANDPTVSVWSNPEMEEGEALAYLLLGRPLRAAGGDSDQLTEAALAMGGNLLAAQLGARLGFDTFEVARSEALGEAALTVGKFLSPRLQLSYGVALFGTGQVVSLRYLLSERLEFELQTGEESRAALNYRVER
jgi:translocation and assembly module TamB